MIEEVMKQIEQYLQAQEWCSEVRIVTILQLS